MRVPDPARFAVHKLIVANLRPDGVTKREKDLMQSAELMESFRQRHTFDAFEDALDTARRRGPKWRKLIALGLERLPTPTSRR